MQDTALTEAIENLYAVFARYLLRHSMDCCPHCTSDDDLPPLQADPLRELSADSLERFSFKAMTTWGDADDFRHFLPRLLELVARDDALDFDLLTSKLNYGNWRTWPTEQQTAIEQYTMVLWQAILRAAPYWSRCHTTSEPLLSLDEFLDGVVHLGSIEPYAAFWKQEDTLPALLNLSRFVMEEGNNLMMQLNRRHALTPKEEQELSLLRQPWVRERLEAAFFDPPPEHSEDEFSLAVSRLDWLDATQFGAAGK